MSKSLSKNKWLRILLGSLLAVAGIVIIVISIVKGNSGVTDLVTIVCAVCCFLYAALVIITSFVRYPRTPYPIALLVGAAFIAIGVALIYTKFTDALGGFVIFLIPVLLISIGSLAIIKAIVILAHKDPVQNWLFLMVGGIVLVAGGIILLPGVLGGFLLQITNIAIGAAIAVVGVLEVIFALTNKKSLAMEAIDND